MGHVLYAKYHWHCGGWMVILLQLLDQLNTKVSSSMYIKIGFFYTSRYPGTLWSSEISRHGATMLDTQSSKFFCLKLVMNVFSLDHII